MFQSDGHTELASDPGRCWRTLRCIKPQVPSHTPATMVSGVDGRPDKIVATVEEKEEIFISSPATFQFPTVSGTTTTGGHIPSTHLHIPCVRYMSLQLFRPLRHIPYRREIRTLHQNQGSRYAGSKPSSSRCLKTLMTITSSREAQLCRLPELFSVDESWRWRAHRRFRVISEFLNWYIGL